jgi:hypothetical protein
MKTYSSFSTDLIIPDCLPGAEFSITINDHRSTIAAALIFG